MMAAEHGGADYKGHLKLYQAKLAGIRLEMYTELTFSKQLSDRQFNEDRLNEPELQSNRRL